MAGLARFIPLVRIRLADSGRDVWIRGGSTDVPTLFEVWAKRAYDLPIPPPETIVDAGANIGLATVFFALRWPGVRVIAVEPEQRNYELLERNTRGLAGVEPVAAALWSAPCELAVLDPGRGPAAYLIPAAAAPARQIGTTRGVTVANLCDSAGWARVGLLKLDIEGSEIEVLDSSRSWIDRVDALIVELHDRILPGCTAAYERATRGFGHHESSAGNAVALRIPPRAG
jgi:FkbM family methyltransferase